MKYSLACAALVGYATAYPQVLEDLFARQSRGGHGSGGGHGGGGGSSKCAWNNYKCPTVKVTSAANAQISANRDQCGPVKCTTFDPVDQFVSVSGAHAYQKPGKSDIRGPCPGLNAAANHGYLHRSGVSDFNDTVAGLFAAYAMSPDVSGPLAIIGIEQFGDLLLQRWSIGGPVPGGVNAVTRNSGISWSHNNYESDGSQTRCDAYMNDGDAHSLIVSRFADTYINRLVKGRGAEMGQGYGYTLDSFAKDYVCKSDWSIAKNPLYESAPFAGTIVAPVAYQFIINFMSNHSATNPGGWLSPDVYKSFFAMSGNYPNFKWNPGQERIPEAWYRRPSTQAYSNPLAFGDLIVSSAAYPDVIRLGCNKGKVNTYTPMDASAVLSEFQTLGFAGNFSQFSALTNGDCPGNSYNPQGPAQNY